MWVRTGARGCVNLPGDSVGSDRFQISINGLDAYPPTLEADVGGRIDYAQIIKAFSCEGLDSSWSRDFEAFPRGIA